MILFVTKFRNRWHCYVTGSKVILDEGVSISVQSSEPTDVTEVSVIHTADTEKMPDSAAADPSEINVNSEQADTAVAENESREKSEELVKLSCFVCLL